MASATGVQWMSRDERGSVLVSTMMLVFVMTLIGAGIFYAAVVDNRVAFNNLNQDQTFYTAEAGLNVGLRELADSDGTNDFASVFANGGSVTLFTNKPLPVDAQGNALGSFTVTAQAVANSNPKRITVTATGCMPAATGNDACPSSNTQTTVRTEVVSQIHLAGPFFALGKFTLSGNGALVDSFNSSVAPYATQHCQKTTAPFDCGANVTADGGGGTSSTTSISIGNNTTIYGNVTDSLGVVSLNSNTNIYGDVIYAPSPNGSCPICTSPTPVHGTASAQPTTAPIVPAVQPCGTFTSSSVVSSHITGTGWTYSQTTGDFSLPANKSLTLAPLASGTSYCFHTLSISGTFTINSTTDSAIISLTGGMSVTSTGSIANTTSKALQFQVLSSATCTGSCTPSAPSNSIQISGGSDAYLYIYAPRTQIVASGGGNLYGALLGNDLQVSGGSRLHYDQALGNAGTLAGGIPSFTWNPGAWKTCKNPTCT
jgi:Tfp pilus assembly protein PilX